MGAVKDVSAGKRISPVPAVHLAALVSAKTSSQKASLQLSMPIISLPHRSFHGNFLHPEYITLSYFHIMFSPKV